MRRSIIGTALVVAGLTLAGCGTRPAERTLSGAAIGAAVGGVTGAVTDPRAVDLGRPTWR